MNRTNSREAIREEAARWVVRLADGTADDELRAFGAWQAADSAHDLAYQRECATWERLGRLSTLNESAADRDFPHHAEHARWHAVRSLPARSIRWVAAAMIVVVAVASPMLLGSTDPAFATGIGETRSILLADDSRVELNTDTSIVVRYDRNVRSIELVKGELFVEIDRQDRRPFVVLTDGGEIVPTGNRLDVRLAAGGLIVNAVDGAVRVSGTATKVLPAGYVGSFTPKGDRARAVDPAQALAWRQGAIDLRGQSLQEAVDEFNRYNHRQIVIADREVAAYRLGGYFRTRDVAGFVRAVETAFPVKSSVDPTGSILLTKRIETASNVTVSAR